MLPETGANRSIEVYKCTGFPDLWEFHATLMSGIHAVDATLFPFDQRWWMFVNMTENEGASSWDELHLFYADHPLSGNWTPHPQNPVISDVQRARPAGSLVTWNGQLFRPAQDCSGGYGSAIRLNRVTELTPEEYSESEVCCVRPAWEKGWRGTHTFQRVGRLTMLDGLRWRLF